MPISNWYLAAELLKLFEHLRIDLHHVKRLAHYQSIGIGVEDIEFVALDDVNNVASGDRLEARDVKVLAAALAVLVAVSILGLVLWRNSAKTPQLASLIALSYCLSENNLEITADLNFLTGRSFVHQ